MARRSRASHRSARASTARDASIAIARDTMAELLGDDEGMTMGMGDAGAAAPGAGMPRNPAHSGRADFATSRRRSWRSKRWRCLSVLLASRRRGGGVAAASRRRRGGSNAGVLLAFRWRGLSSASRQRRGGVAAASRRRCSVVAASLQRRRGGESRNRFEISNARSRPRALVARSIRLNIRSINIPPQQERFFLTSTSSVDVDPATRVDNV